MFNSLSLGFGVTLLSLLIGVPYALFCAKTDIKAGKVFSWLSILPLLIPPYIHAIVWNYLGLFLKKYFIFKIHSLPGAIFVLTLAYFPFIVLMTLSGLKSIDRKKEEASLLYHGKRSTFMKISLPLAAPHIIAGALFVFIFSIINVGVPDFLRVKVYPIEIFIQFSAFYDNMAATLLSIPLVGITFLLLGLQKHFMGNRSFVQLSGGVAQQTLFNLNQYQFIAVPYCMVILFLSALLPIIILFIVAGPIEVYIQAVRTSYHQIGYSFILALVGSFSTLILGFSLAYIIKRSESRVIKKLSWLVMLPLAIPATTIGIGLIGIWNNILFDIIYGSSWIVIIAYTVRFTPFAVLILISGIEQINKHVEEAAVMAGISFFRIIKTIMIPHLKQNIAATLAIIFILAFGEIGTTLLIIPPGKETIPIKIYNLMHYGSDQTVAALCLFLIGIIVLSAGVFIFWYHNNITLYEN